MVELEIRCPSCKKLGKIDVQEDRVSNSQRGITTIGVARSIICDHSFVAYIDTNFDIRDCFISDFTVELPELVKDQRGEHLLVPKDDLIDLFLLTINFGAQRLAYIIRAILMGRKVVVINDIENLNKHVQNLLIFGVQDAFQYDTVMISLANYRKERKKYKNHIIIDTNKILNDKGNLLADNRMKIENTIIEKFLREDNDSTALLIFRNEIWKAREITNEVMHILSNYESKNKMSKKALLSKLREKFSVKITFLYLEFILDILKNYEKFDLNALSEHYIPGLGV